MPSINTTIQLSIMSGVADSVVGVAVLLHGRKPKSSEISAAAVQHNHSVASLAWRCAPPLVSAMQQHEHWVCVLYATCEELTLAVAALLCAVMRTAV